MKQRNLIQFPEGRSASFLWAPTRGTNPAWRLGARNAVLQLEIPTTPPSSIPELGGFSVLIDMMADEYANSSSNFMAVYDKFFPHGPSKDSGVNRFTHAANLFEQVEEVLLAREEQLDIL